jgi:hypothetical protein
VKTLLDEEFFGRFLDPVLVLFDRAGAEFWHPPIKTNVRIFILSEGRCQG